MNADGKPNGPPPGFRYSDRDGSSCHYRHTWFARHYMTLTGFGRRDIENATAAAIRTGYGPASARKNAWRLLRYPDTQAEIRRIIRERRGMA